MHCMFMSAHNALILSIGWWRAKAIFGDASPQPTVNNGVKK